jgi:hypothetical protein
MHQVGQWPEFNDAMHVNGVLNALCPADVRTELELFRDVYNTSRTLPPLDAPSIPRLIHQIWLGSPLPKALQRLSDSWRRLHPDWELKVWTDADVDQLDFGVRDLYDQASCWGQKSDLLRVELLDRFGGVYVDLDYECFRPIDELVERFHFFGTQKHIFAAHLGWPDIWHRPVVICNSLIGARPGHPVLRSYLDRVRAIWQQPELSELKEDELPKLAIAAMGGFDKAARIKETGVRTFIPFGDVVTARLAEGAEREVVLPPVFLNPVTAGVKMLYLMPEFWQQCRAAGIKWPDVRPYTRSADYTFASHLSENSWI